MAPLGSDILVILEMSSRVHSSIWWFFTWNNYNSQDIELLAPKFKEFCEWYVFQEEKGENGTPHLQGTIKLKKKGRPIELFGIKTIHWEKTKNIKCAITYCTKEETRVGKIYTNIQLPKAPRIIEYDILYDWQKDVIAKCLEEPDERTINWYWDANGCTGKTTLCRYLVFHHNALCVSGKSADCKHGIIEYEKKNKLFPIIILCNVPRSNLDYINYEAIESIKDGLFFSGKYESGQVLMDFPHVFIFANEPPNLHKMSKDRWNIIELA